MNTEKLNSLSKEFSELWNRKEEMIMIRTRTVSFVGSLSLIPIMFGYACVVFNLVNGTPLPEALTLVLSILVACVFTPSFLMWFITFMIVESSYDSVRTNVW